MVRPSALGLPRLALPILVTLGCLALSATATPEGVAVRGAESSGAVLADGPVDGGGSLDLTMPGDSLLAPASPSVPADPGQPTDPALAGTAPGDVIAGSGGSTGAAAAVPAVAGGSASGIPGKVLAAYQAAAASISGDAPSCHLPWSVLAGIGKVESGHARGGALDENGRTLSPILGPVLDGSPGFAAIRDTDGGRWDGNSTWDRAVGPMQFIPGSWRVHGSDGNRDGVADPSNVFDAAAAAAGYLCTGGRNLSDSGDLRQAVFGYNHSWDYVATVLAWAQVYANGGVVVTASTGTSTSIPTSSAAPGGGRDNPRPTRTKPSPGPATPTPRTPAPTRPGTPSAPGSTAPGTTPGTTAPGTPSDPGTPANPGTTTTDPGPPANPGTTPTDPTTPSPTPTPPPTTPADPPPPPPTCPTPPPTCPPPVDPTAPTPPPDPCVTPPPDPTAPTPPPDPCATPPATDPTPPPTTPLDQTPAGTAPAGAATGTVSGGATAADTTAAGADPGTAAQQSPTP